MHAGSTDFVISSSLLAFDADTMDMMECITVILRNDTILEQMETFTLELTMADAILNIDSTRSTATVNILDMDCEELVHLALMNYVPQSILSNLKCRQILQH